MSFMRMVPGTWGGAREAIEVFENAREECLAFDGSSQE